MYRLGIGKEASRCTTSIYVRKELSKLEREVDHPWKYVRIDREHLGTIEMNWDAFCQSWIGPS